VRALPLALTLLLVAPAWAAMPEVGERAPRFALRDIDGERVRFPADAGSRPVVVLFWASWCPYCKALMPHLAALKTHHGEALDVYAVNFGEQGDQRQALRAMGLPFVMLPRGDGVAARYAVQRVPALFLVHQGRVVHRLEHPPVGHPARGAGKGRRQAAMLAEWWTAGLREALERLPSPD
jgi:cytochrome c biogenesis protein CcmG, thiol:disulfide interchange protein DsbE